MLTLFCYFISFCLSSTAWWNTGHELTAQVAKNNLTPAALKIADKYLKIPITYPGNFQASKKTSTFIEASVWCDVIKKCDWKNKKNKKINSMFHHINPLTFPGQAISATNSEKSIKKLLDSKTDLGRYNCYTALQSSIKSLADKNSSLAEKAVAFRFILHLVGDIHMPLHNAAIIITPNCFSKPQDKLMLKNWLLKGHNKGKHINGINTLGGGGIILDKSLFAPVLNSEQKPNKINNLHGLWDSTVGLSKPLPHYYFPKKQHKNHNNHIASEAQNILKNTKQNKSIKDRVEDAKIINWIIKSNMLAAEFTSPKKLEYFTNPKNPNTQVTVKFRNFKLYLKSAQKVCRKQIYVGGMRMAKLLNAIFDPKQADKNYFECVKKIKADKTILILSKLFPKPITFKVKN